MHGHTPARELVQGMPVFVIPGKRDERYFVPLGEFRQEHARSDACHAGAIWECKQKTHRGRSPSGQLVQSVAEYLFARLVAVPFNEGGRDQSRR